VHIAETYFISFFDLLHSMSMKVPTIVQEAQQALQDGYCVVIGLQSTGEVGLACLEKNWTNPAQENDYRNNCFS